MWKLNIFSYKILWKPAHLNEIPTKLAIIPLKSRSHTPTTFHSPAYPPTFPKSKFLTHHFHLHQKPPSLAADFYSFPHHSCPSMMNQQHRGDETPIRICFVYVYNFQLTLCALRSIFGIRICRSIVLSKCYSNTCRYLHQLSLIKFLKCESCRNLFLCFELCVINCYAVLAARGSAMISSHLIGRQ